MDDELDLFKNLAEFSKGDKLKKFKQTLATAVPEEDTSTDIADLDNEKDSLLSNQTSNDAAKTTSEDVELVTASSPPRRTRRCNNEVKKNTPPAQPRRKKHGRGARRVNPKTAPRSAPTCTITLDSDDDPCTVGNALSPFTAFDQKNPGMLVKSFDNENPEISVKFIWKNNIEVVAVRKYQKFSQAFQKFADQENVPASKMVLTIEDRIVNLDDTPASVNYKIYEFIRGRIVDKTSKVSSIPKKRSGNILVKVQLNNRKQPLNLDLAKTDKLKILYIKCSEELSIPINEFKLSFDGDTVDLNSTPCDIGLEGGEIFDLVLKAN